MLHLRFMTLPKVTQNLAVIDSFKTL